MKTYILLIILTISSGINQILAQDTIKTTNEIKYVLITKNSGATYQGYLISQDAREVKIETSSLGEIIIPKHEIASIEEIEKVTNGKGKAFAPNLHATRYSISTNGLPVKKGTGYVKAMVLGLDCQFALTDNWSIGGMSSWAGIPVIVTSKYSFNLAENINASAGILYGNLLHGSSLVGSRFGATGGGIGFGNLTFGNNENNLNFGGGYGFIHEDFFNEFQPEESTGIEISGATMISAAGMYRIGSQAAILIDMVGVINDGYISYWINPAIRYMPKPENIWQFGFAMTGVNGEISPWPIPAVSFTKVFKKTS